MSDLISRSELIKYFEAIQSQECVIGLNFVAMIDVIKEQPTAYSVDKVVDELEEIICPKRLYFCRVSKGGCNKSDDVGCIDCAIQKAIEIVKRGGKNE